MNSSRPVGLLLLLMAYGCLAFSSVAAPAQANGDQIRVLKTQGTVELKQAGARTWAKIQSDQPLYPFDQVRTGPNSSATLRWSDSSVVQYGSRTEIEILPPHAAGAQAGLHLLRGLFSFFHRDEPGRIRVISRGSVAGIEGTEFVMAVDILNNVERTTLSVIDGRVGLTNDQGFVVLTSGQEAVAVEGQPPQRTAGFVANNLLQWAFYYPAVLDLRDLPLSPDEEQALADSRTAYRSGDLLDALAKYGARQPNSDAERIYQAALLLSVGEVTQSSNILAQIQNTGATARIPRLAASLQQLIAAVKRERVTPRDPELPTELLAASYYEQSRAKGDVGLRNALEFATRAATNSPDFGFAWARVAELEFSFGHTDKALDALNKSLAASPRNAQALALKGFLLAAQNKPRQAIEWFNRAIAVDAALANAWLGRGLCRIRQGESAAGREDLLIAAALEPRRAQLRSYLGKSFGDAGDKDRALHELELAKDLDAGDPTAWFYSALVKAEQSRINEAIRDLKKAQELNDNRGLFRSEFRLDQDEAVRSVSLARMYADSDLDDVAVREAGRAVSLDYANYSAHAFLASSYENERRANLSNLRFEAASFNEFLLASLLGPANGRLLALPITQLEYSSLFERNRVGVIANTEYFGSGAWRHSSAQYGTLNGSSYSLEAEYRSEPGERHNQDLEIRQLEAKFKHDLTPDDSLYLHVIDYRAEGGDIFQHFDEREVARRFRFEEDQTPTLLAGYHHQWSEQNHTLALVGRFDDTQATEDPSANVFALDRRTGTTNGLVPVQARNEFRSRAEIYSAEVQQIAVVGRHSLIAGSRVEFSELEADDRVSDPNGSYFVLLGTNNPVSVQNVRATAFALSAYVYDYVTLTESLRAVVGLNFTHQNIPENTGSAPITSDRQRQQQLSPKAGIVWSPAPWTDLRGSYTRSLTGFGLAQTIRLEPAHIAGLPQTFRAVVPPSLVGGLDGVDLETAEVVWETRFSDTFFSIGWQRLAAENARRRGLFLTQPVDSYDLSPSRGLLSEKIDFTEQSLDLSVHRLLGREWSFGARYRLSYAEIEQRFPQYRAGLFVGDLEGRSDLDALLHSVELTALYRHPMGVFARIDGNWFAQDRHNDGGSRDGDNFWQINLKAGYRFPRQRAELTVGLLNITDKDYRLDPLNSYSELPRSRTFYAQLLLNF